MVIARVRSVLEAGCWSMGLMSFALYAGARVQGESERRQAVAAFTQEHHPVVETTDKGAADPVKTPAGDAAAPAPHSFAGANSPRQDRWSETRIRLHAEARADSHAQTEPVALLRIVRVGLEVPVYSDASERNLNRGAGLVEGTAAPDGPGNVGIAAHRDGYFRVLQDVEVGDVLELDSKSQRRRYRVSELSIVPPTDVSPLDDTSTPAVTLVTCYPFHFVGKAPQRYIVRAVAMP